MRGFGAVQTVLRRRGADGQARRRARDRPGRAAAAERAEARRRAADRPADHRLAAGRRDDPRGRRARAAARRRSCRATRCGCPAAPATRRAARACAAASASRSASRTSRYSEGFDDYCAARVRLLADGSAEVHCAAAEVGQGVHRRDPPGRAHRARDRRRAARAGPDRDGRLGRLGVGVAHDVDGGRRRARRVPRRARGAGAPAGRGGRRRARSTATRARRRSTPRRARSPASARTSRSPRAR